MKNCAIVCEYNPFHTGHKYQLETVKNAGTDNIYCIMSGNFVQSAMPAFCDKSIRAECAVKGGANAVIELPAIYATASAQQFAEGAVKIISQIKEIGCMAMGATAEPDIIKSIAEVKNENIDLFRKYFKSNIEHGISYNNANLRATEQLYGEIYPDRASIGHVLTEPNNILCIEYISALCKYAPNIEPFIIKRKGAIHNDSAYNAEYISATAIRNAENEENIDAVEKYIPFNVDKIKNFRKNHSPDLSAFKKLTVFALKTVSAERLKQLRDCSEGMEYLLKSTAKQSDFDDIVLSAKSKRYGEKRLNRIFLDILLDIKRDLSDKRFCTRLLACKSNFDFSLLPRCVLTNNADIKKACAEDAEVDAVNLIDVRAADLYNTLCSIDGGYYNYSLIKV